MFISNYAQTLSATLVESCLVEPDSTLLARNVSRIYREAFSLYSAGKPGNNPANTYSAFVYIDLEVKFVIAIIE